MKISEIITDRYKLRIPPTVYYELLADVLEAEEKQEPTTKNDLGVDLISRAEVLKLMQDNWHTHNGDWAMQESMDDIRALPSVTPQELKTGYWIDTNDDGFVYHRIYKCSHCGATVCEYPQNMHESKYKYCSTCGVKMVEPQESEVDNG